MRVRGGLLASVTVVALGFMLAACGGENAEEAAGEPEATTEAMTTQPPSGGRAIGDGAEADTSEDEFPQSTSGGPPAAPAPAPGGAVVALDDGRVLEAEVRSCTIDPNGTFQVNGGDAAFTMAQLILGDQWQQSQVELEVANGHSVYVIVSGASEGAEQATVAGKRITWTADTFRELDPAANRHVYEGQGTVQVACP